MSKEIVAVCTHCGKASYNFMEFAVHVCPYEINPSMNRLIAAFKRLAEPALIERDKKRVVERLER